MKGETGNALFLILIAVALFAALSYAVTQSSRGGGNIDREQRELEAAQILQHVGLVASAVQRMSLIGGVEETDFQFNGGNNPNCTTTDCDLFSPNGGGLEYSDPKDEWLDASIKDLYPDYYTVWEFYAMAIQDIGTTCTVASCSDLVIMLEAIDPDICALINDKIGISGIPSGEDFVPGGDGEPFAGTYYGSSIIGDTATELAGQRTACFLESDATPSYVFYHVLLER